MSDDYARRTLDFVERLHQLNSRIYRYLSAELAHLRWTALHLTWDKVGGTSQVSKAEQLDIDAAKDFDAGNGMVISAISSSGNIGFLSLRAARRSVVPRPFGARNHRHLNIVPCSAHRPKGTNRTSKSARP